MGGGYRYRLPTAEEWEIAHKHSLFLPWETGEREWTSSRDLEHPDCYVVYLRQGDSFPHTRNCRHPGFPKGSIRLVREPLA